MITLEKTCAFIYNPNTKKEIGTPKVYKEGYIFFSPYSIIIFFLPFLYTLISLSLSLVIYFLC